MPKFLDVPQWYTSNGKLTQAWTSNPTGGGPSGFDFLGYHFTGSNIGYPEWKKFAINPQSPGADYTIWAPVDHGEATQILKSNWKSSLSIAPPTWENLIQTEYTAPNGFLWIDGLSFVLSENAILLFYGSRMTFGSLTNINFAIGCKVATQPSGYAYPFMAIQDTTNDVQFTLLSDGDLISSSTGYVYCLCVT